MEIKSLVDTYWLYDKERPGQKQAVIDIVNSVIAGKPVTELDAPTAAGKTVILYVAGVVLNYLGYRVLYTSPQVELIDQIDPEFTRLARVKGLKNYDCPHGRCTADDCVFVGNPSRKKCPYVTHPGEEFDIDTCDCPYYKERYEFDASPFGACTLALALVDPRVLPDREVVFIDESSTLEDNLLSQYSFTIPKEDIPIKMRGKTFSIDINDLEQFEKAIVNDIKRMVPTSKTNGFQTQYAGWKFSKAKEDSKTSEIAFLKLAKSMNRYYDRLHQVLYLIKTENRPFVVIQQGNQYLLKLVYGNDLFKLRFGGKKVVLASGTPNSELITDVSTYVKMQHPIAPERRSVIVKDLGFKLTQRDRTPWETKYTKLAAAILDQVQKYDGDHVIVHCSAYKHARELYSKLSNCGIKVFLQQSETRKDDLEAWKACTDRCIYLCTGREEGVDLKERKFNLNIVAKLSWADLSDPWVSARMNYDKHLPTSKQHYARTAAIKLLQACGRTTRTPEDYSVTVILEPIWQLQEHVRRYEWFKEALVAGKKLEA